MATRNRVSSTKAYFATPLPRVLAHRGLATNAPENTLASFEAALDAGAVYIETDVNASADGIAITVHDPDLQRVAGVPGTVAGFTLAELQQIDLGGGVRFATLAEALAAHPEARFNIDIKSEDVAAPAAAAIIATGATDRVLITSFSTRRRRAAVELLGDRVAASASAGEFVPALVFAKLGLVPLVRFLLRRVDAVQIPQSVYGVSTVTRRMVRRLHAAGVEVHVWTINDVEVARRLLENGVDGIVTDRADLMLPVADSFRSGRP